MPKTVDDTGRRGGAKEFGLFCKGWAKVMYVGEGSQ